MSLAGRVPAANLGLQADKMAHELPDPEQRRVTASLADLQATKRSENLQQSKATYECAAGHGKPAGN